MKKRIIKRGQIYKRIVYSILISFCMLFCWNQKNVRADAIDYEDDPINYEDDIDGKCNIGKTTNVSNFFSDNTAFLLKLNRKTRIKLNISARIFEYVRDENGDLTDDCNYNMGYTMDDNLKLTIYSINKIEGEDYADDCIDEKEVSYKDNIATLEKTIVLDEGKYLLDLDNDSTSNNHGVDYSVKVSDATIFIQDFQLPNTMTMYYGKKAKMKPTNVSPSKYDLSGLTYSSSNDDVIEIDEEDGTMEAVGSGKSTITATAKNGLKRQCVVTVKNGTPKLKHTKLTMYHNYGKWLDVLNTDSDVKWKSSNKKIVTVNKVGYLKAKKIGKATITAKVDGKTLKCKVTVKREPVNFHIDLYGYDTRSNTFNLTITNRAKNKLRIYSSGAYSLDKDYKRYDRKLKLTRSRKYIDVKGKKSKDINFKVNGSRTWWDVKDAEVYFYVKFDGKKFKACGDYEDGGYYYSGGKWKETSKNEDDY